MTRHFFDLAKKSKLKLLIYLQLSNAEDVKAAREAADAAGYYGPRIYVEKGSLGKIHLADNLADAVIALGKTAIRYWILTTTYLREY